MKRNLLLTVAFVVFAVLCVVLLSGADKSQKVDRLEIQRKTIDLKAHQLKGAELQEKLEVELNKDTKDQERIKQLEVENQKFQQETQELQKQLQAKAEAKNKASVAARSAVNTVTRTKTASASSGGSCASWMAQAGIPNTTATNKLILKESGCRPNAVNPSSGACGIPQAYPCSKLPCSLNEAGAVCQLQWMSNYVKARYGSWEGALSAWYSRCGSAQGCWY